MHQCRNSASALVEKVSVVCVAREYQNNVCCSVLIYYDVTTMERAFMLPCLSTACIKAFIYIYIYYYCLLCNCASIVTLIVSIAPNSDF